MRVSPLFQCDRSLGTVDGIVVCLEEALRTRNEGTVSARIMFESVPLLSQRPERTLGKAIDGGSTWRERWSVSKVSEGGRGYDDWVHEDDGEHALDAGEQDEGVSEDSDEDHVMAQELDPGTQVTIAVSRRPKSNLAVLVRYQVLPRE